MKSIAYQTYFDKVYGCFLGKCVGGTAGGPAEGRKELLDYPLDEAILHTALPNDDLDLQILWLEVMEEKGIYFTSEDLADSFYRNVPYGPGEYAYFMKNYARGILPPVSGAFNNRFYCNGMGCPIRSEIWACICPGEPKKTMQYVSMDGHMDHLSDSVWAEYFLAYAEAAAFFYDDTAAIPMLIEEALAQIPAESRIAAALSMTLRLWKAGKDWKFIRSAIIRHFGHPDCTNLYQNMSFTLLALLFGQGDMRETIRLGCAMGYDTDCICATAASLVGIIRGADMLLHKDGFTDTGIKAAVKLRRPDCSIAELAKDVAVVGMTLCDSIPGDVVITEKPDYTPIPTTKPLPAALTFQVDYAGDPVLPLEKKKTVLLTLSANQDISGTISVTAPDGIIGTVSEDTVTIAGGTQKTIPMSFVIAPTCTTLNQENRIAVCFTAEDGTKIPYSFGLNGADIWYCYGPFFHNNFDLTDVSPYIPYGSHMQLPQNLPWEDPVRDYHLNRFADIDIPYLEETTFFSVSDGTLPCDPADARTMPEAVSITEDYFEAGDLYSSTGPAVSYLFRYIDSPENRPVDVTVGCEGPFKLWINGTFIGENRTVGCWTLENKHFYSIPFHKGRNTILFKLCNPSGKAAFSIIYRIPGKSWIQYTDFASEIIKTEE